MVPTLGGACDWASQHRRTCLCMQGSWNDTLEYLVSETAEVLPCQLKHGMPNKQPKFKESFLYRASEQIMIGFSICKAEFLQNKGLYVSSQNDKTVCALDYCNKRLKFIASNWSKAPPPPFKLVELASQQRRSGRYSSSSQKPWLPYSAPGGSRPCERWPSSPGWRSLPSAMPGSQPSASCSEARDSCTIFLDY